MLDRRGFLKIIGALGFAATTQAPAAAEIPSDVPFDFDDIPEPIRQAPAAIEEVVEYPKSDVVGLWLRPHRQWISLGSVISADIQCGIDTISRIGDDGYVEHEAVPGSEWTTVTVDIRVTDKNCEALRSILNGDFNNVFPASIRTQYDRFDMARASPHATSTWRMEFMPGQPALSHLSFSQRGKAIYMDFAKTKGVWPRPAPTPAAQPASAGTGASISSEPLPPIGDTSRTEVGESPQIGITGSPISDKVFTAEGVLKEALRKVIEQAKTAKLAKVDRVVIRLFEYGDAFKLIPIANSIAGTKRSVTLEGGYTTTQDSEMMFEFKGEAQDASTIKDYLEPQFRAAKVTDLKASILFDFEGGLALDGDAADKFIEKLTRFASAAAYVEATAEVK